MPPPNLPARQASGSGIQQTPPPQSACPASLFVFACPELEAGFQAYSKTGVNLWAWACYLLLLAGWVKAFFKLRNPGKALACSAKLLFVAALLQLVPMLAAVIIHCVWPSIYSKHQRKFNLVALCGTIIATPAVREILVWMGRVDAIFGQESGHSPLALLRAFADENLFLAVMWLRVVGYPTTPPLSVGIILAGLAWSLNSNEGFCKSHLLDHGGVTMSVGPLAAAQWVSDVVLRASTSFHLPLVA
jgi:hypothetical protein